MLGTPIHAWYSHTCLVPRRCDAASKETFSTARCAIRCPYTTKLDGWRHTHAQAHSSGVGAAWSIRSSPRRVELLPRRRRRRWWWRRRRRRRRRRCRASVQTIQAILKPTSLAEPQRSSGRMTHPLGRSDASERCGLAGRARARRRRYSRSRRSWPGEEKIIEDGPRSD